jgi:TolB-like protein
MAGAPAAEGARIAVIPFESQGDTANAYFADGMADAVRGKLSELPGLTVIARSSSAQYAGSTKSLREVAEELGVRYVLTGTVRWAKMPDGTRRVQLSPELVEVADGVERVRWQQPFDAPLTDVFQVQSDIAGKVAGALDVALGTSGQQALAARPTQNLEAYDAFLRAEAATQQGADNSPGALRKAEELFELAVQRDPAFALAWARLAGVKLSFHYNVTPSPTRVEAARAAIERAEALAPDEPFTLRMRANYELNVRRDFAAARAAVDRAIARSPNDIGSIQSLVALDDAQDKVAQALAGARRTRQLDPRSARRANTVGELALDARDYPLARDAARQAYALAPNENTLLRRVMVEVADGDLAAARAVVRDGIARLGRSEVGTHLAVYFDLFWVLEPEDFRHVLGLTSDAAFGGERHFRHVAQAQMLRLSGDTARARAVADSALVELAPIVRDSPDDAQYAAIRGLMLALAGRRADAVAAAERAVALARAADRGTRNYTLHQAARIHLELGDRDKALDLLEPLLTAPYYLSPGWLRLDRTLDGLRGHPRFEALAAAAPHRLESR